MRLMRRQRGRWALAILLVVLTWPFIRPLFKSEPAQDDCAFGPISNVEYRALLAEADRRSRTSWRPIHAWIAGSDAGTLELEREIQARLMERFHNLITDHTDPYRQIAGMHAVMRSVGATYRISGLVSRPNIQYSPTANIGDKWGSSYAYYLDIGRIRGYGYISTEALIGPRFDWSRAVDARSSIDFGVLWPRVFPRLRPKRPPKPISWQTCPEVPPPEWVVDYKRMASRKPAER